MPSSTAPDPRNPAMSIVRFASRCLAALAMTLAGLALVGCASLPAPMPRTASSALQRDDATPLGHLAAEVAAPDASLSGLRLLPDGDHALNARLALIRRAQRSLDLQYYLVAS